LGRKALRSAWISKRQGKTRGAQKLRGAGLQTEQILRSGAADGGELGRFASWHIGCIRRMQQHATALKRAGGLSST
jgi:hypothetical protein